MERYFVDGVRGGDDTSESGGGGGGAAAAASQWLDSLPVWRRRYSSPSPTAAFLASAAARSGSGDVSGNLDPALLRYTRSRLHLPPSSTSTSSSSSSSSLADSSDSALRRKLQRLLRLRSSPPPPPPPLGPMMENVRRYKAAAAAAAAAPVKVEVEEDVLVMDGVLVSEPGSSRCGRSLAPEFASPGNSSLYKTEICRTWEDAGTCRYGSKCQFAHGKEELRVIRPLKQRPELERQSIRSIPAAGSGSNSHGLRFRHLPPTAPAPPEPATFVGPKQTAKHYPSPASKPDTVMPAVATESSLAPTPPHSRPPPSDSTFPWPPSDEEDACITRVLYGPSSRRRLPVFAGICPE